MNKEKSVEEIPEKPSTPLKEIALVGRMPATSKWAGMMLEIQTSEFNATGEEPHIHLFSADHRCGDPSGLITRIALTEKPPEKPEDIHSIKGNPPIPKDYIQPIFKWSKSTEDDVNNWKYTRFVWKAIQASVSDGEQ